MGSDGLLLNGTRVRGPRRKDAVDARILQTREVVLSATLEIIAESSVAAATVERIAERSGVARSTIYRRWPDLSELLLEAFERIVRTPLPKPKGDLGPELRIYLADYAGRLNDPMYFSVLIGLIEWGWRDPAFAKAQAEFFDERPGRAAAIVRAGKRAGAVRGDLTVKDAVKTIEAPFLYTRMIDQELITPGELERVHRDLVDRLSSAAR